MTKFLHFLERFRFLNFLLIFAYQQHSFISPNNFFGKTPKIERSQKFLYHEVFTVTQLSFLPHSFCCTLPIQVLKSRALSYGCLPLQLPGSIAGCCHLPPSTNGAHTSHTPPTRHHNCLHHIPAKRRHSSIAVMDCVSSRGSLQFHPGTPMDTVIINTKDTSLAQMDRQRKTSWSKVVGSCDYRSMDTGLNELDRICGKEAHW